MSFRGSLCFCFCLLAVLLLQDSTTLCWGRQAVSLGIASEHEGEWMVEGRSLKVRVNDHGGGRLEGRSLKVRMNDYEDPSANRGHDPRTPAKKVGNGNHGGRRG
ncbi:uncharacterized protein J3R85_020351 [Psidium guajava]|nr:uncharacterized protein J3R85_020351 [Psidium guajava]